MSGTSLEESSSSHRVQQIVDESKPLWNHVECFERPGGASGGNAKSKCRYCGTIINGSYSRVKAHLLKISGYGIKPCPKVTVPILEELREEVAAAEAAIARAGTRRIPLPGENAASTEESSEQTALGLKKRKVTTAIEKSFHVGLRSQMDALVARSFYTAGLPFNLARNPYWREMIMFACNNNLGGYAPPAYNKLRTTLLQQEKTHVETMLEPIKTTWGTKGVTIASDGWSDAQRRPLINFLAVTEGGPMFLRAINTEGEVKKKEYIADKIIAVVEEIGAKNVVQVVTDNAPVCKAAGMIVEQKYNNIFWTPCVVHTLNLALKNICAGKSPSDGTIHEECEWIGEIATDASIMKNFIMNHSMRLAMFNEFSKLKMLAIAETRFASVIIMLKRFYHIRAALKQMVICDMWESYRDDNVGTAQFVKEKALDDMWWDKVRYLIEFTDPIYSMLRQVDTDKPCLHLVYEMWDTMIEKVKDAIYKWEGKEANEASEFYCIVHGILVDRWAKSNTPLHCMAHALNPRYYSEAWIHGGPNRQAPHDDNEINQQVLKCLRKFYPVGEEYRKMKAQFADFSQFGEGFDSFESIEDRAHLKPKQWWGMHGGEAPALRALALKLLGQPSSSSCCERNWSTYGFIHSMKRNKLTPQRAEDLVFVHTNMRLLSRKSEKYLHGTTMMWDVGADSHESFTTGVGVLENEIANLSLDEPELEMELCEDGGQEDDRPTREQTQEEGSY